MENSGTSASTLDKKWSSSGWNGKFYWYRTIGRSGKTWFQCGISANDRTPSSGTPSHFFTCKLMPRVGYTEQKIMKACEETAKALKFHRGPTGGRCDSCDFRNVQEVCTLGRYSMSRSQFRMMMDRHDKVCSCGCFDVGCHAISITETSTSKLTLGQNIELSDDLSAEEWTFVPEEGSPSKAYWTRTVKSGDETWNQYGVSKDHQTPHDDQPDFAFTCKNIPREGKSEQYIRRACQITASYMSSHRRRGCHNCTCTFETLRARGGRCTVGRLHVITKFLARFVEFAMRQHDEVCSCGCFDVPGDEQRQVVV